MKIATWNVNGIRARASDLNRWIEREQPDILCLQELKASPEQIKPDLLIMPGYIHFFHGQKGGYSGVSLHLKESVLQGRFPRFFSPPFDMESRIVVAEIEDTFVASIYAPNGGKNYEAKLGFWDAMIPWVRASLNKGKNLILCGDFNIAPTPLDSHPSLDKPDVIGLRPEERERFSALLGTGLVDSGRHLHPQDANMFTWWPYWRAARQKNIGWRIDMILVNEAPKEKIKLAYVQKDEGTSDHAPWVTEFEDWFW